MEADSEPFDCQACPVAEALDRLQEDRANWEAWVLFRRIVTRFSMDTHTIGAALERATRELEAEPYGDLIDRFTLIYDALYPPAESKTE